MRRHLIATATVLFFQHTTSAAPIDAEFVGLPAGTFEMGSPASESWRNGDEVSHSVVISRGFEMQRTEVTQAQWLEIMGRNPSRFQSREFCPDDHLTIDTVELCPRHPVESIAWTEAQEFIRRLNARDTKFLYRLPTEAEWEYAARAGTTTPFSFGSHHAELGEYSWHDRTSSGRSHAVGQLKPNAFGLHDMHGNVWEFAQDWYAPYDLAQTRDPRGPIEGLSRSLRGGSWFSQVPSHRSARRNHILQGTTYSDTGFRLARVPLQIDSAADTP